MAEFPALPLFTDALIADTQHLTDEEFGAYIRLLILEWRTAGCRLPADAAWHMRRLGVDQPKYSRLHEPILREFFSSDGNFIIQRRLLKEFGYLVEQRTKQSARAKARWSKEKTPCRSDAASGNAPHPTPPKEDATASSIPLPPWLPPEEWSAFKEMRKRIKHPLTPYAEKLAIDKLGRFLHAGYDIVEILNQSILNNWKDLYEPKKDGGNNGRSKSSLGAAAEGIARAAARREQGEQIQTG